MDQTTTTTGPRRTPSPVLHRRARWTLTVAGQRALAGDPAGDLHREPGHDPLRTPRMTPMTDPALAPAFARVDLLLDEALLTLARTRYRVAYGLDEMRDRLDTSATRVRARLAVERELRGTSSAEEATA